MPHTHAPLRSGTLKAMALCKIVLSELGLGTNEIHARTGGKEWHMFLYYGGEKCVCLFVIHKI